MASDALLFYIFAAITVIGALLVVTQKNPVYSVLSLIAWLTFGALLLGRWRFGWRGRKARNLIVAGSAFLVLAYLGYKFVLEVVLGR